MTKTDGGPFSWQDLPVRDDLRALTPYGAPQLDVPVRLNTNENPYPPPPELVADLREAVTAAAATLNRYPDRDAVELRKDLAQYLGHGLTGAQLWAANGSNEVIQQILQCFGGAGRSALGFEPSYTMHRLIALATGTRWIAEPRGADFSLDPAAALAAIRRHGPDVVFLTSPNNPTGNAAPRELVEAVVDAAPGVVVIDEAYAEFFRPGTASALSLLPGRPRLIVIRTMSKAFAMAGARVGYLAADPAVIDALLLVRLPYHLSALTQAAARTALAHVQALLGTVDAVKAQRDRIVDELTALGLPVVPSDANFVAFGVSRAGEQPREAGAVWQALLDRGVLVRDVGLAGMLRVTAGTPEETGAFLTALKEIL
ncbi:histidinol-phosphate transaminase [Actinocrinis puniceicyclus]|uniref:Histidinol-phosphate aminotransferase n=1 Tax=Actinocrinis puniceicyclus TaxID=977794 RepID=A0A8J7WND4_9ACTN|nr:histidinol-phosphate transaminase [Actinocrinis puniceicyclus]MBS2965578.1 histidinol-phosphate transaminase [Actinocrinis puniceicyclus]